MNSVKFYVGLSMLFVMRIYPIVIGHRGACGYAPENTCMSFEKAIELGVQMIEFDVRRCKSGELVVMHDNYLENTTDDFGYIADKELSELKKIVLGVNQKIPTLEQALDCINRRARVYIEIKEKGTAHQVVKTIHHYIHKKGWQYDDFIVASFNHYEILETKKLSPQIPRGVIISSIPVQFEDKVDAQVVIAYVDFIEQHFVTYLHNQGKLVYVYTVNHPEDIKRMLSLGVDGIISDYPDRVLSFYPNNIL